MVHMHQTLFTYVQVDTQHSDREHWEHWTKVPFAPGIGVLHQNKGRLVEPRLDWTIGLDQNMEADSPTVLLISAHTCKIEIKYPKTILVFAFCIDLVHSYPTHSNSPQLTPLYLTPFHLVASLFLLRRLTSFTSQPTLSTTRTTHSHSVSLSSLSSLFSCI